MRDERLTRKVSITGKTTASDGHATPPDDTSAGTRAELLDQIVAAQFDLEAVIADLTRDGAPASSLIESRSQLGALTALARQMAGASPSALANMRADIAAVVATSQTTGQQARTAAASRPDAAEMIGRAQEARAHVDEVMQGMKDFDPYLRFSNEREEIEYRGREAERTAYIAAEQAKGIPTGDLNASGAAIGQMGDAAAHGADNSPEFRERWDGLVASTGKLREAVMANGGSTQEFDRRLREDLRRIMKSKGLSDAQIDAEFAAHPDPLDAAKAYVGGADVSAIAVKVEQRKDDALLAGLARAEPAPSNATPAITSLTDAMATMKAAGVVMGEQEPGAATHGVTAKIAQAPATVRTI